MEEDKLMDELENVRKEIRGLKRVLRRKQKEGNLVSLVFFLVPFGVAIMLYSADILNQALDFHPQVWYGYLGIAIGIFFMIFPLWLAGSISNHKK